MKPYILAAVMAAMPVAALADTVGQIDTTRQTVCKHVNRSYRCFTDVETRVTMEPPKPRPRPEPPRAVKTPTTTIGIGGVRIMRGMPE